MPMARARSFFGLPEVAASQRLLELARGGEDAPVVSSIA